MKVKVVLKQTDSGTGDYITLVRDCHDFEWECDSLALLDSKRCRFMIIPMENVLYLEVLEYENGKG